MTDIDSNQPRHPIKEDPEDEPDSLPVEPDQGPVPDAIPEDPLAAPRALHC